MVRLVVKISILVMFLFFCFPLVSGVVPSNATNYYNFSDSSGSFIDYNRVSNMSITGSINYGQTGVLGSAVSQYTVSSYGSTSNLNYLIGANNWSASIWIKPNSTGAYFVWFGTSVYSSGLRYNDGGSNNIKYYEDGNAEEGSLMTNASWTTTSTWHHWVVTHNVSGGARYVKIYYNGSLVKSISASYSTRSGTNMRTGYSSASYTMPQFMDEWGFWNGVVLSDGEVGGLNDSSGLPIPYCGSFSCGGSPVTNSCSYSSGDWDLYVRDDCNITVKVNMSSGSTLIVNGTGASASNRLYVDQALGWIKNFSVVRWVGVNTSLWGGLG